jgi:outer membrane protein TolC
MKTHLKKHSWMIIPILLFAMLSSAGCTSLTNPRLSSVETELPDALMEWREDVTPAPVLIAGELTVWWQQLDDPVLDELVERIIAGSVDIESTATRALRGKAKSKLDPSISSSLNAARVPLVAETVVAYADLWVTEARSR